MFVCVEKLIFVDQTRVIPRLILGSKNSLYVTISQDAGLEGSWKEWQFKFLQAILRADAGMVQINWAKNFYWWIHFLPLLLVTAIVSHHTLNRLHTDAKHQQIELDHKYIYVQMFSEVTWCEGVRREATVYKNYLEIQC